MRYILIVGLLFGVVPMTEAAVVTKEVTYEFDGTKLKGHIYYDDAIKGKRPGVMVVHEWWGLNEYAKKRAEMLAKMGYVGFAIDMYGDGKITEHPKEAGEMAGAVRKNEKAWSGRVNAAYKLFAAHELVDATKIGAIGYCFGGSTVMKLAYSGADVKAVVSFHGAITLPSEDELKSLKAKMLICHGAEDDFIKEADMQAYRDAMKKGGVDYQVIYYAKAKHSFTVPEADKVGNPGLKYQKEADERSWSHMKALFAEAFGK